MFRQSLPPPKNLFLLTVLAIFSFPAAQAATLTVTNLDDNGPGSLRQAILSANAAPGADTIVFQAGLSGTITIANSNSPSGAMKITDSLTINGPGANVLAISGNYTSGIFSIDAYQKTIAINGLTLKEGNGSGGSGGALYNDYTTLMISNSILSGNTGRNGGGIYSDGGAVTITNSTLSGNSSLCGSGIYTSRGTLAVTNSTLSGNSATLGTWSCDGYGGGIYNDGSTLTVINSTLSGNSAEYNGGGICFSQYGTLKIGNSIVVGNAAPAGIDVFMGQRTTFISKGYNLFSQNGLIGATPAYNDLTLTGAIGTAIGPLADNGGPTKTHLPVTGSLAIDHGDNALIPVDITTDQRGSGYPRIVGGTVDIGAVEVGSSAPPATGAAVGVFRAGTWFLDANGNGAWDGCQQNGGQDLCLYNSFGQAGDMPAAGNWNGGAKSSIGVLRSGTGEWFIDHNGNHQWDGCGTDGCYSGFGAPGDLPVAGDWNGTGFAKIGVFRNGQWFLDANGNGAWDGCGVDLCLNFGQMGDWPVAGNWDGGLKAGVGVFRNGTWFLDYNGNGKWDGCQQNGGQDQCLYGSFGQAGDLPAAGDWNGDGKAKVGVFRNGTWFLDYNGNGAWDGCAVDRCYVGSFGVKGDLPVAGKW